MSFVTTTRGLELTLGSALDLAPCMETNHWRTTYNAFFTWPFIVAEVQPILGMDFLGANYLLVDPKLQCLICRPSNLQGLVISSLRKASVFDSLLMKFPFFRESSAQPGKVAHGVQTSIVTILAWFFFFFCPAAMSATLTPGNRLRGVLSHTGGRDR